MKAQEHEYLKKLFESRSKPFKTPSRTVDNIVSTSKHVNPIKLAYIVKKYKENPTTYIGHYHECISNTPKTYKIFLQNYNSVLSQSKKIAICSSKELKKYLSKTSKVNPILKSRRINRELMIYLKKQEKHTNKKEIKKDNKEELRQERKFNYLLNQTEAFASFLLNKKNFNTESSKIKEMISQRKQNFEDFDEKDTSIAVEAAKKVFEENEEYTKNKKLETYEYKKVDTPKILNATLKNYQLKGLRWLVNLYEQGINGILADDMGLGKTVQSLSFLAYLSENEGVDGPFLIISPSSTLYNWSNEIEKFIPDFSVLNYWGNLSERKPLRKLIKKSNVIITSYQLAVIDFAILKKIKWNYLILDEAQAIKSFSSQRWTTLLSLKVRNRLLLTGTPIQNNMQELWSLLHFIMPTLFDSLSEFSEWFSKDIVISNISQVDKLHTILKPFMLRRHKNDVIDEIGSKEIIEVNCKMSHRQEKLHRQIESMSGDYENTLMHLKKICNHPNLFEKLRPHTGISFAISGPGNYLKERSLFCHYLPSYSKFSMIKTECDGSKYKNYIGNLKQIVKKAPIVVKPSLKFRNVDSYLQDYVLRDLNRKRRELSRFKFMIEKVVRPIISTNELLFEEKQKFNSNLYKNNLVFVPPLNNFISDSGKLARLDLLLEDLKANGHRVLIYFQMTKMMDIFENYLAFKNFSYLRLDGSSRVISRKNLVDSWQNEDIFIFILSTRAGGVGINLTAADTVIFYDSDWNPTVDQQAMDRVHRLGQTKDVTVYRLITENSVEERIMEKANVKDKMQKIVIKGKIFEGL